MILNKCDLADPAATKEWVEYYKKQGIGVLRMVATDSSKKGSAVALIEAAAKEKVDRLKAKGVHKTVRVMVVGIPNVGKSTFINKLSGVASTVTATGPASPRANNGLKFPPGWS